MEQSNHNFHLDISNLYGLKGELTFKLGRGINAIPTPHGEVVTRSLALLAGGTDLENSISDGKMEGSVQLTDGTSTYYCKLKRELIDETPFVANSNPLPGDYKLQHVMVVDVDHPLFLKGLTTGSIRGYLQPHTAGVKEVVERRTKLARKLRLARQDIRKLKDQLAKLKDAPSKLNMVMRQYAKEEAKFKELLKEAESGRADREVIIRELIKAHNDVRNYNTKLRDLHKERDTLERNISKLKHSREKLRNCDEMDHLLSDVNSLSTELAKVTEDRSAVFRELVLYSVCADFDFKACPICSLAGVSTKYDGHSKRMLRKRASAIMEVKEEEKKRLDRKIRELTVEKRRAQIKMRQITLAYRTTQYEIRSLQNILSKTKESIKTLMREYTDRWHTLQRLKTLVNMDRIPPMGCSQGPSSQMAELRVKIQRYTALIQEKDGLEDRINTMRGMTVKLNQMLKGEDEILRRILYGARDIFNKNAKKLMNHLGFESFTSVSLDGKFNLNIMRRGGKNSYWKQPPLTLSSSETTTLVTLLALAVKENYYPNIPIFAVRLTGHDSERSKKLAEWIAQRVPVVIAVR